MKTKNLLALKKEVVVIGKIVELVKSFLKLIFSNKLKILSFFIFLPLFIIVLFPFGDVSELITGQIAKASGNKVFLRFEEIKLGMLPSPSIDLTGIKADVANFPSLEFNNLSISPSFLGLLTMSPGANIQTENFLKSEINLDYQQGEAIKEGVFVHNLDLEVGHLDLSEVDKTFTLPIRAKGSLDINSKLKLDPTFKKQPEGDFSVTGKKIRLPSTSIVPFPGWEVLIPEVVLKSLSLSGQISESNLVIDNLVAGELSDKLQIKVKGQTGLEFSAKGPAQIKNYNLRVQISIDKQFSSEISFLEMLEPYLVKSGNKLTYQFKMAGKDIYNIPNLSKLKKF